MVVWKRPRRCRRTSIVTAPPSEKLVLLFLRPVGLDPKTPWIVSFSSMLETTHKTQIVDDRLNNICCYLLSIIRLGLLTYEVLQDVLHTFDELTVNLNGQIAKDLLVL